MTNESSALRFQAKIMDCQQARNLFDVYLDGDLSPSLVTEMHAHRLTCPSCREELAVIEVAGHVIASGTDDQDAPADFTDRLLACLEPSAIRPHPLRLWTFRIGGGIAAAACLTLAIMQLAKPASIVAGRIDVDPAVVTNGVEDSEQAALDTGPSMADAAETLGQSLEDALLQTRQSSDSLIDLGKMTFLQMIDTIQLNELRDNPSTDPPQRDPTAVHDADDVEEL